MLHNAPLPAAQVCCGAADSRGSAALASSLPPAPSVAQGNDPTPHHSPCCRCCLPPPPPRCAPPLPPTALHPAGQHPAGRDGRHRRRCSAPAGLLREQCLSPPPHLPSASTPVAASTHLPPRPVLPYGGWVSANHSGSGRHLNKPRSWQQRQLLQRQRSTRAASPARPPLPRSPALSCATGIVGTAVLSQSFATLTLI